MSVTKAKGFKANGLNCGIKRSKLDLALIASDVPAVAAGVFTKSSVKAAPLIVTQRNLLKGKARAIVVNSGNANCFTGRFGFIYAKKTTELFGKLLGIPASEVVVASTGIIGKPLPYNKIEAASEKIVKGLSTKGDKKAATAILTTDLKVKESAKTVVLNGKKVTIGGCAKGSGMVAPNMATMLGFITTDAAISAKMLKSALAQANSESFNCVSVDGCMSTNDMVVVLANGAAGNKKIVNQGKDFKIFVKALKEVCLSLAKEIVIDGEGATKFIEINVQGAKNSIQARQVGLQIANSVLFKTAAFGKNPNWGRVAAAIGSLGIKELTEEKIRIRFSSFAKKEIVINVDLHNGSGVSKVYTCDLSYEYVRINAEYN